MLPDSGTFFESQPPFWIGGPLAQVRIHEGEVHHRFDDGYGPGQHTGIMSASRSQSGGLPGLIYGILPLFDRGCGLEGQPKKDGHTVGNAPLDSS